MPSDLNAGDACVDRKSREMTNENAVDATYRCMYHVFKVSGPECTYSRTATWTKHWEQEPLQKPQTMAHAERFAPPETMTQHERPTCKLALCTTKLSTTGKHRFMVVEGVITLRQCVFQPLEKQLAITSFTQNL